MVNCERHSVRTLFAAFKLLRFSPTRYLQARNSQVSILEGDVLVQKYPFTWFLKLKDAIENVYKRRYSGLHCSLREHSRVSPSPPSVDKEFPNNGTHEV